MQVTLFDVPGWRIEALQAEDPAALQALLERCADYSRLVSGAPPRSTAAEELFTDCPDGKTAEDKLTIGIYSDAVMELCGVLDVVRGYPTRRDWWLGLLLIDPQVRGQGLGQQVYRAFEGFARQQGAKRIYLGVVEENQRAYQFWEKMGFTTVYRQPARRFGDVEHVVIVMLRTLKG